MHDNEYATLSLSSPASSNPYPIDLSNACLPSVVDPGDAVSASHGEILSIDRIAR